MKTKTHSIHSITVSTIAACAALAAGSANAHTSYGTARDFGTVSNASVTPFFKTINTVQTVTSDFGWAAGTEAAFGDAHDIKAYRFALTDWSMATIRIDVAPRGSGTQTFLPGFSIYSGLLHTTGGSDYDTAQVTKDYLESLGEPQPRRGAFNALGLMKMGNDAGVTFDDLSVLTYVGNAADGTSANFGTAPLINGDGAADGSVTASFWLPAGDYSLLVGGANLSGTDGTGTYGINATLAVIPEPSGFLMLGLASLGCAFRRRRA